MCVEQWAARDLEEKLKKHLLFELYGVRANDIFCAITEDQVKLYLNDVLPKAIMELQLHAEQEPERLRTPRTPAEKDKRRKKIEEVRSIIIKYVNAICAHLFCNRHHWLNGLLRSIFYTDVVKYNILNEFLQ